MKRKLSLLDEQTGELMNLPIYLNSPPRQQATIYGSRWLQMSQDAAILLAEDDDLDGLPTKVLMYLYGTLDFENYIHVSQAEVATRLRRSRQRVNQAMGLLVKKQILIKGPSRGHFNTYRLNPAYGWKGDNKKAREYQLELIKGGRE